MAIKTKARRPKPERVIAAEGASWVIYFEMSSRDYRLDVRGETVGYYPTQMAAELACPARKGA